MIIKRIFLRELGIRWCHPPHHLMPPSPSSSSYVTLTNLCHPHHLVPRSPPSSLYVTLPIPCHPVYSFPSLATPTTSPLSCNSTFMQLHTTPTHFLCTYEDFRLHVSTHYNYTCYFLYYYKHYHTFSSTTIYFNKVKYTFLHITETMLLYTSYTRSYTSYTIT